MSPGIVLAILFVAMGAQITRLLVPRRGSYPLALGCAAAGLLAAELLALQGHGGPAFGAVHPLADAGGIAVVEAAGLILVTPRRLGRR